MSPRPGASASFSAWTAQRIEVFVALPGPGESITLPADAQGPARLPGVVLTHGEHPRAAVVRAVDLLAASTSVLAPTPVPAPGVFRLGRILSDVRPLPGRPELHALRLVFELNQGHPAVIEESLLAAPVPAPIIHAAPGALRRVQRPAAYAVLVQDGEVLLTRVTGGMFWTLPGGGIDHGEHPDDAVHRETFEETGLELLDARLSTSIASTSPATAVGDRGLPRCTAALSRYGVAPPDSGRAGGWRHNRGRGLVAAQ
jgi:8-oxo-dGTP pyrophosphatase MutT (NUDIX family)